MLASSALCTRARLGLTGGVARGRAARCLEPLAAERSAHASGWRCLSSAAAAPAAAEVRRLGVLGAGQMGAGIALVAAQHAKLSVQVVDSSDASLKRAAEYAAAQLGRAVAKGKLTEAASKEALARLAFGSGAEALADADFVIEALPEDLELKKGVLRRVAPALRPAAVLASNTSSIPISKLAAALPRPESVVGMHFFNPVPVLALVEVIVGARTSEQTVATTMALARAMDKQPVRTTDSPGFVVNRNLLIYINEAVYELMEGVSTAEDIDTAQKLGTAVPIGPLALADLIGLDTCLQILRELHAGLGDRFRPCPLLIRNVDAGLLGRKSGRGFFTYDK